MLTADDFSTFFHEVHGCPPFPWQKRLLAQVAAGGEWPHTLDLPTGSGKTAAIDIALFHLALEADRFAVRRAPVRIAFVVDRRLVVDDAFERAKGIADATRWSLLTDDEAEALKQQLSAEKRSDAIRMLERVRAGTAVRSVAQCLTLLSGDGPPLIARRLRGGIPREDDWARTPSQPTVLCSTVDQVGSRLLFRGYGVSDSMKPVHAGLIGSDCLILLDEAHLAEPFRQTMDWIGVYRGPNWRESATCAPWGSALLTATPGEQSHDTFSLDDEDRSNPVLKQRLEAAKPAFLVAPATSKKETERAIEADDADAERGGADDIERRASAIVEEIRKARRHFEHVGHGATRPAIGVVANRVGRARAVFEQLRQAFAETAEDDGARDQSPEIILMIGPARPVDRDDLVEKLKPIRTRVRAEGENRALDKPFILVATQCIEVGVDIDLDALITEAAPLDSLRQRFGRLNRAGRRITPYAAIVADKSDISARADDPVYGKATKQAWDYLNEWVKEGNPPPKIDFGVDAMKARTDALSDEALSRALTEKPDAPVLLPAHLDLLSQTSPIPKADPDVALYLHGTSRQPDSVTIIWRADIDPARTGRGLIRLLTLVPPRSREAIELPVWTVRRWLEGRRRSAANVADIPARGSDDEEGSERNRVFRWKGDDERSRWIEPSALLPGDTIIVPASYGGVDAFGWNPECELPAKDVAQEAAKPFAQKRFAVRVAPGLLERRVSDEALAASLAELRTENAETARQALLDLDLPAEIKTALEWLEDTKGKQGKPPRIVVDFDLYGANDKGEPRGVVFLAPFGVKEREEQKITDGDEEGRPNSTEDDTAGLIFDFPLSLKQHSCDVESKAEELANKAGLVSDRVADLKLAGFLHDAGKADPRFQAWLNFGDPLGFDPGEATVILAKSGRTLPPAAREKAGLPDRWRHEALSVRLARMDARLKEADDPDLVLWLIGTHHGHGRPLFPHQDAKDQKPRRLPAVLGLPDELPAGPGPQSLAFDWNGLDWSSLFTRLKARYGVWELARMEAILRLADHRASEEARERSAKEEGE